MNEYINNIRDITTNYKNNHKGNKHQSAQQSKMDEITNELLLILKERIEYKAKSGLFSEVDNKQLIQGIYCGQFDKHYEEEYYHTLQKESISHLDNYSIPKEFSDQLITNIKLANNPYNYSYSTSPYSPSAVKSEPSYELHFKLTDCAYLFCEQLENKLGCCFKITPVICYAIGKLPNVSHRLNQYTYSYTQERTYIHATKKGYDIIGCFGLKYELHF